MGNEFWLTLLSACSLLCYMQWLCERVNSLWCVIWWVWLYSQNILEQKRIIYHFWQSERGSYNIFERIIAIKKFCNYSTYSKFSCEVVDWLLEMATLCEITSNKTNVTIGELIFSHNYELFQNKTINVIKAGVGKPWLRGHLISNEFLECQRLLKLLLFLGIILLPLPLTTYFSLMCFWFVLYVFAVQEVWGKLFLVLLWIINKFSNHSYTFHL